MKNFLYFCGLFICLFLITGCGGKTLKCSRNNDSPDGLTKIFQEISVSFKNEKPSSLLFKMNVSIDDQLIKDNNDIVNGLADSASSEFENIKNEHGVSYSISKKDNGFDSKLKIDFDKLDDDTKKKIYLINHQSTYTAIKDALVRDGYSCK